MDRLDVNLLRNLNIPGMEEEDDIEKGEQVEVDPPNLESKKGEQQEEEDDEGPSIHEVDSINDLEGHEEEDDDSEESGSDEGEHALMVKYLASKGLLDIDDEEELEDSEDLIVNKFQDKVNAGIEAYKSSLPDAVRNIIDRYEDGVPIGDYLESQARLDEYSSISEDELKEDVELQKQLVATYLSTQDYTDEEIKSRLQKYEDNMLLEDEASSSLKRLTRMEHNYKSQMEEQAAQSRKLARENYEKAVKSYSESVMGKKEIIPGIPLTDAQKKKIVDATTKPVATDRNGRPINLLKKMEMEDPDFVTKVAYVAAVLNWDLSPIEKKAKTKAASKLKKQVNTYSEEGDDKGINIDSVRKALRRAKKQNKIF